MNTGIFAFAAQALRAGAAAVEHRQRAGRAVPAAGARACCASRAARVSGHLRRRRAAGARRQRPRRPGAGARARAGRRSTSATCCAGVTIVDPAATVIDVDVEIGQDTVIEPFTTIRGSTTIGAGCTVRHSYLVDCVLEDGVSVGPFAYLRPGTVLRGGLEGGDVRGGQELRHRRRARRSRTCPTSATPTWASAPTSARRRSRPTTTAAPSTARRSGEDVRTGVDTTLVAPVTVGDGAYTGAGSVITEDVPPARWASPASARATTRATGSWRGGAHERSGHDHDPEPSLHSRRR